MGFKGFRAVAISVLCCMLILSITACAGGSGDDPTSAPESATPVATQEASPVPTPTSTPIPTPTATPTQTPTPTPTATPTPTPDAYAYAGPANVHPCTYTDGCACCYTNADTRLAPFFTALWASGAFAGRRPRSGGRRVYRHSQQQCHSPASTEYH